MRRRRQKQILESLATLREANAEIKKLVFAGEIPSAVRLLSDAQDCAVKIGCFIEQFEGENTNTGSMLEEYCEALYRVSLEITNTDNSAGHFNLNQLKKRLSAIENSVRSEFAPDKIEAVFFPYQAAMWDSFESIYLAAKADPACDAYCVPIPWYERRPDGSFGAMHYEGGRFPSNIEITDYRGYDVETRRPDVIFLHNPYDEANFVTSVDPKYYSRRLKAHSDCLVYVEYGLPYWVYKNPEDEHEAFRTAAIPPAHVYCDLYIAYSTEMAASIKLLLLLNKDKTGTESKRQADEKAVALGSPKFDKVLHSKRENHALPKEWSELIDSPQKKIILFNTSIGPALKDTEAYLQRLRDLLGLFKSAADVALWWRPHPLLQSTFDSMRAGLAGAYRAIVKEYRRGAWGVYDDTEDLYRAISWSDAYYGDESSLVYLYLATGKPFALTSVLFDANGDFLTEGLTDFRTALQWQINNMKACKGGNIGNWNTCIWWHNFSSNEKVEDFLRLFLHYVAHTDEYPEAEEYKRLKLQMFHDFVTNSDGAAGQKIYDYCKNKVLK